MDRRRGHTLIELVTLLAVMAVLAAVAVPSASSVRGVFAGRSGAERLALVLRAAQAQAQSRAFRVDVTVRGDGRYEVVEARPGAAVERGELGTHVTTNYPDGALSFGVSGSPCLFATTTPRAGSFALGSGAGCTVVVQLGGCIRCR
jgi:type II secretory pathway pseudopilin PulG